MWEKISFKGVIIGAVADVVGTNVWGAVAAIYLSSKYHLYSLPVSEQVSQLTALISTEPVVTILNVLIGSCFTIMGGFIAARIARHDELLNGTLASFLCVLFALLSLGSSSIVWVVVGIVANPLLAFSGGYLSKRKHHS
jgi:hypothetical protein